MTECENCKAQREIIRAMVERQGKLVDDLIVIKKECRGWENDALALSHKIFVLKRFLLDAPLPPAEALDHIMELIS